MDRYREIYSEVESVGESECLRRNGLQVEVDDSRTGAVTALLVMLHERINELEKQLTERS